MENAGVPVNAGTDYHLVLYYESGTTMYHRYDNSSADGRSMMYNGSAWEALAGGKWRLRPVISSDAGIKVVARIFLEGAYYSPALEMTTLLNQSGNIPLTSPYTEDPRSIDSMPGDITDWVLVELRETINGEPVATRSALLRKDGMITADNGIDEFILVDVPDDNYYVVIIHRNHLTSASANTVYLTSNSPLIDLTTGPAQFFGEDAALLSSGVYGAYAGDTNASGVITNSDKDAIIENLNNSGYYSSDTNMSGVVTNSDKDKIVSNLNKAAAVQ